jgi:pyruvate,orthophosphate dikinase
MVNLGLNVPAGFTLTTDACLRIADPAFAQHLRFQIKREYLALSRHLGYAPLVSVRSGARKSMPGMMDTVLNVGCTDASLPGLIERIGEATARDSYRRLVVMYGEVVKGIEFGGDSKTLELAKSRYVFETGEEFPQDFMTQLTTSIEAVFASWTNQRAIDYRNDAIKKGELPVDCHNWGTACNVQMMVFGNSGENSGSGVLFTRDCANGAAEFMAEFLVDAQGEDVVAGTRTPLDLIEMPKLSEGWGVVHAELLDIAEKLEAEKRDAQDIEFTVEDGKLFILQTRTAKRTGLAAIKIARDFVSDKLITKEEAFARLTPANFAAAQLPQISPKFKTAPYITGIGACPGVVTGTVALNAKDAIKAAKSGPVILVAQDTTPDDLAGMLASVGVLTAVGGKTSHAAVVAREKNIPTVCGAAFTDSNFFAGEVISIDGTSGNVWKSKVPVVDGSQHEALVEVIDWVFEAQGVQRKATMVDRASMTVETAGWIGDPKTEKISLARVKKLKNRSDILLAIVPVSEFRNEVDAPLWNMFGADTEADCQDTIALIDRLVAAGLKGTAVQLHSSLIAHADRLRAAGYKLATEIKCLDDLVLADGPVFAHSEASEAAKKVLAMRAELGNPVNFLPGSLTVTEAITKTFGG